MQFWIPLKVDAGGWAGADYETTIDASYGLYTTQLKNYPVANAFEYATGLNSQEFWGLQLTSRAAQNTSFQSSLSLWLASGTGNLDLASSTAVFERTINQIIAWNLKMGVFVENILGFWRNAKTTYVGTAGGNRYLINTSTKYISTHEVDANNAPIGTSGWSATEIGTSNLGDNCYNWNAYIAAVKGDKIWIWYMANFVGTASDKARTKHRWSLYTLNSNWTITLVSHTAVIDSLNSSGGGGSANGIWNYIFGHYIYNWKSYCHAQSYSQNYSHITRRKTMREIFEIDLSVTGSFSYTVRKHDTGEINNSFYEGALTTSEFDVWYDNGTNTMYYIWSSNDIYSQAWTAAPIDTGNNGVALAVQETYMYKSNAYFSAWTGAYTKGNDIINQSGVVAWLPTQTQRDNILNIYEITTLLEETNNIYKTSGINGGLSKVIWISTVADSAGGIVTTIELNGTVIATIGIFPFSTTEALLIDLALAAVVVADTKMLFEMKTVNSGGIDHKIGFWITGGTFATPTFNYEVSELNILL